MQIDAKLYDRMPDDLRALFVKLPNPRSDEVMAMFPESNDSGSAARFFACFPYTDEDAKRLIYCPKAGRADRAGSRHPTVKPLDLLQYLCRLITPPGGTVLDCFAGSGTTGEAASREGFRAVLVEREAEYLTDIARRMGLAAKGQRGRKDGIAKAKQDRAPGGAMPLFADAAP